MEFRQLGHSGLKVPFRAWGASDVNEAIRLVDICLEAGVNLFDTADIYSNGLSEEILGKAVAGRRDKTYLIFSATDFAWVNRYK